MDGVGGRAGGQGRWQQWQRSCMGQRLVAPPPLPPPALDPSRCPWTPHDVLGERWCRPPCPPGAAGMPRCARRLGASATSTGTPVSGRAVVGDQEGAAVGAGVGATWQGVPPGRGGRPMTRRGAAGWLGWGGLGWAELLPRAAAPRCAPPTSSPLGPRGLTSLCGSHTCCCCCCRPCPREAQHQPGRHAGRPACCLWHRDGPAAQDPPAAAAAAGGRQRQCRRGGRAGPGGGCSHL